MATNGLVLIKPSSVAKTGASSTATINAGGSVTFDLCETLSLNDVFSSAYDNYIIDIRHVASALVSHSIRFRTAGTDDTTVNSYTSQYILANNTSVTGARATTNSAVILGNSATARSGTQVFVYGPNLAQPTAARSVTSYGEDGARIFDCAVTHNQSTAYDGFTILLASGTWSGFVKVYGLVK